MDTLEHQLANDRSVGSQCAFKEAMARKQEGNVDAVVARMENCVLL